LASKVTREDLLVLKELIEAGKVTPVIDRTYPLSEAAAAIRYMAEGHACGKTVLTV
jgi:NADPH:quinone reductase-like Zn-dependent oxidoreductase